ncbi:MAG: cupin domain-containing protein [Clostridiales bacterium]|nr:cupin domain-containing protein [Clostridiales bacterium]
MLIDYLGMEEKANPNFKGGEKEYNVRMFNDGENKYMKGRLVPGASIGYHKHEGNFEIIYVISGEGTMINDEGTPSDKVIPGQAYLCADGHSHSLVNTGSEDLIFFAVVAKS